MKQFFKFMFASMLGLILGVVLLFIIFAGIIGAMVSSASSEETEVESKTILHIKLDENIIDRSSKNPFENFDFTSFEGEKQLGLNDILANIEKAKNDDHIEGIFLDVSSIPAGIAIIEEIRAKLEDFKRSKKFIVSYSEAYGQSGYYLASVADKIYLNPQGALDFKGLKAEVTFFKNTLAKLELEPQIIRHGKFKAAVEPFILEKMSPENKEQMQTLLNSMWFHMVGNIAKSRKMSPEEVNNISDQLLIRNASDAVKYKLADKLAYKDEVLEELRKKTEAKSIEKTKFVTLAKYFDAPETGDKKEYSKDRIAVIYAVGAIESGEGNDETIGSERISKAIREARMDDKVKAIVLRVNSPGGSALASDVIWREVVLAKKAKPVIVSMGNLAASGGYYIACGADTIVAEPNTLTGSIGVFGMLLNAQGFLNNKLGVTIDTVKTGTFADIGTPTRKMTAAERDIIQQSVEEIYDVFISRVAEGRNMSKAEVDSIGQGRIWSGIDGKRIGLVDVLGGLDTAIAIASRKAGLENYRIVSLPRQKDPLQEFLTTFQEDAEEATIKGHLGGHYKYYEHVKNSLKLEGVQARMPFEIEVY